MVIGRATFLSLWTAVLALVQVACPCGSGRPEIFHESFESACGDLPCGWQLIQGNARLVETYHSGEHALELSGNASISHDPSYDVWIDEQGDYIPLVTALICHGGATLAFTLTIDNDGHLYTVSGQTDPTWTYDDDFIESIEVQLTPIEQSGYRRQEVRLIEIQQSGSGACILDDLRILGFSIIECMG